MTFSGQYWINIKPGKMIAERRIILQNTGEIDPEKIDDYISAGGYLSAAKALSMPSSELIEEIIKSGLRGRGEQDFRPA